LIFIALNTPVWASEYNNKNKNKEQGRCIWDWYLTNTAEKNGPIEAYMKNTLKMCLPLL
jgi:hypothetical protein